MGKKKDLLFWDKVVTAQEMARLERLAPKESEAFMLAAGKAVAQEVLAILERGGLAKRVVLLVGKGNKGGDAFVAGVALLEEGVRVRAVCVYLPEECSELNRKFRAAFLNKRGQMDEGISFEGEALIVDGLLGTGFKGKPEGRLAQIIEAANGAKKPIVAIDLPSGLDGTTGEVRGAVIRADETVALGMAKAGFFLRGGWNCIGQLKVCPFGLPKEVEREAEVFALLPRKESLAALLPPMVRTRHKYQAGYVVGLAGSDEFKGAPKLAGFAALRAGAGIVRVFHRGEIGEAPPDLILEPFEKKAWARELKRAKAVFVGPGMGQSKEGLQWLKRELKTIELPCVVDADALQKGMVFPQRSILTPHRGEMLRLLGLEEAPLEEALLARCQTFCKRQKVILVLKGAPTFIFSSERAPVILPFGDPGMAKAGSGDVLTGILAALLAQGLTEFNAALLGVALHGLSGEEAAKDKTSYGEIATDLIEYLPKAFQLIMKGVAC